MAIINETSDAPPSVDTPYFLEVGDSFRGTLSDGDSDAVRVELSAGTTYEFNLTGWGQVNPLHDPIIGLVGPDGYAVAASDDICYPDNLDSRIVFTAPTSGTYFIEVWGWNPDFSPGASGDYELRFGEGEALPDPYPDPGPEPHVASYDEIAHQLTDGNWEYDGLMRRSFDVAPGDTLDVDISVLGAEGQQLARWALEAWTNVSGIGFRFVEDPDAHITFGEDEEGAFSTSVLFGCGDLIDSSHVNVSSDWLDLYGTSLDSYSFSTYIHEIGHALGLGHAGNYNVTAIFGIDNDFLNDSWQATVMSYFSQDDNTWIDADAAFAVTPMIADIIAIQDLYGEPAGVNAGHTVYGSNSNVGGYLGELFAAVSGEHSDHRVYADGPITLTIQDTDGTDTFDLRTDTHDQRIDLSEEGISDVFGLTGNLIIARGTTIENVIAGTGNDTISGNVAANRLEGRAGNDVLTGEEGSDHLIGGGGFDLLEGGDGDDHLTGGTGHDTLTGGAGEDTLIGNAGNDLLAGGTDNDRLIGGGDHDRLFGGGGGDRLEGGSGHDNLAGGAGNDMLAGNVGHDALAGGDGDDRLIGGGDHDRLTGGAGDDTLIGGRGSDLFVFGLGNGTDTIIDFSARDDHIDLTEFGLRAFSDLALRSDSTGVRIDLSEHGGGSILLQGSDRDDLDASDFLL